MNRDSRLSVALHVLLHLKELERAVTSEELGALMDTNPVVIRRTLGGLRDAGIVRAERGRGGGWSTARDLTGVSVAEVYEAIGSSTVFGIGPRDPETGCPIEQAVNRAVGEAMREAEEVLMKRLRGITAAEMMEEAQRKLSAERRSSHA